MPPRPTLEIVEIFPSIQGEGLRQGEPTVFVRLAGCNLRCAFCDTKRAWRPGRRLTVEEIVSRVRDVRRPFAAAWVSITGGEPFLQDMRPLVRRLRNEGLKVQVETNGRRHYPLTLDWLTVSPKPPGYRTALELRRRAREVKLIVSRDLDLAVVARVRRSFPAATPVILQPESNRLWSRRQALALLEAALAAGLRNIRLGLQLHKILGLR
jgi:7-carboxy-7-deazaguanine synthase